jgi:hypothetical protein
MIPKKFKSKKGAWYEFLCSTLGKTFDFPLDENDVERLSKDLKFSNLNIKPNHIYSTVILVLFIGLVITAALLFFNFYFFGLLILFGILGFVYYLTIYPAYLTRYHRINATNDLVQTIFYLVVSLRLTPNLESALAFASNNVKGIVGQDLKKMMWEMSSGLYRSADQVLESFANKWKKENLEFYEAMHLIRMSTLQRKDKREKILDEAVNLMLQGNMERMKHYASELRNPLMIITTLGITLPVLTIIIFPILTIFMASSIDPVLLFLFYDLILPVLVYYIMDQALQSRPLSLGKIDISEHPKAKPMKYFDINLRLKRLNVPTLWISVLLGFVIFLIGFFASKQSTEPVSLLNIGGGLIMLGGITCSIIVYSFVHYSRNINIRDEIKETEREFDEILFQLGYTLSTGIPLEAALQESVKKTKDLKISKLFNTALSNIKRFGFTFRRALFDNKYGVLKYYPSQIIRTTMNMIADSLEKGVAGISKTVLSVSKYLKSMHLVEEHIKDILDETTSSMKMMMALLVPIASGAVVGMATIMTMVLFQIEKLLGDVLGLSKAYPQSFEAGTLGGLVDIKNVMPAEIFLVVVGIYMLEIIVMLAIFIASLEHGNDPLDKHKLIATNVLFGFLIFSGCILFIYFIFRNLITFGNL